MAFQYRNTTGGSSTNIQTTGLLAPYWVKIVKDGLVVTSYQSPDGVNWTLMGIIDLPFTGPADIGLCVCSHTTSALCTATFDNVSLVSAPTFAAPSPWLDEDIGSGESGALHYENGLWNVYGSGDIWGVADSFHYVYQPISGDCQIITQISKQFSTNSWSKAGLMLRQDLTPGSTNISVLATSGNGIVLQSRTTENGSSTTQQVASSFQFPTWLKLVRSGNQVFIALSQDGNTWNTVATQTVSMTSTAYVGLAVSSQYSTAMSMAVFDNVQTSLPQLTAESVADTTANLYWPSLASNVAEYAIYRNGQKVATTPVVTFEDTQLSPGTSYSYQIMALDASNNVLGTSNTLAVTTTAPLLPAPWQHEDIGITPGTVVLGGSSQENTATQTFTLVGFGTDIWGNADNFQFASQSWSGDGEITARVTSIQNASSWSKAGIMLRNSMAPNAANVVMAVTPGGNGVTFQVRGTDGANTVSTYTATTCAFPVWLRLSHQGALVSGSYSGDGTNWTLLGQTTVNLNSPLVQGLAVTSHTTNETCAAVFDNVSTSTTPSVVVQAPKPPGGLTTSLTTDSQVGLTWTTLNPFIAASYNIYRNGINVGSTTGNNFVDAGLSGNTAYQYTVTSVNASNLESAQSSAIAVTTQPASLPSPWTHMELGMAPVTYVYALNTMNPGSSLTHIMGQSVYSSGAFTVNGAGTQTEDGQTIDAGQFVYQPVSGDTSITMRLDSFTPVTGQSGYVGPMIRESTASGAPVAWGYLSGTSQGLEYRQSAGIGTLSETSSLSFTYPLWMNLQRQGNTFTYSISSDGTHWQMVGQQSIAMASQVLVGFAVGSGSNTALAQAQIDQVSLGGANLGSLYPQTESNQVPSNLTITSTAASATGNQGTPVLGNWVAHQNGIIDESLRGSVQYNLSVSQGDIYELNVQGQPIGQSSPTVINTLLLYVDGTFLGSYTMTSTSGRIGTVQCLTPYLKAGSHTVLVYWDNYLVGQSFEINSVSLDQVGDQNSEAWEQGYFATNDTIDQLTATSITSPFCAEGNAIYPELVSISNQRDAGPLVAQHGAGSRWYANIPLSASGTTSYTATFDEGGWQQTGQVQWLPTELLTSSNLTIRQGDSLLFTIQAPGGATGNAQIVVGKTTYSLAEGATQPYAFTQTGTFTVTGSVVGSSTTHSIQVTVVGAGFNGSPTVWVGRERTWDCPGIAPAPTVTVQADSRITCQQSPDGKGGSKFNLLIDAPEPRYVVARLGTNGPILTNDELQGTDIEAGDQTGVKSVQTYPDGSQLVQMMVVVNNVTPNLSIKISIFVGGVTFADGTTTETLTASDFNSLGEAVVSFIYPDGAQTSVCHNLQVFDGTTSIGSQ